MPHNYYAVLSGCNKDEVKPLLVRSDEDSMLRILIGSYNAIPVLDLEDDGHYQFMVDITNDHNGSMELSSQFEISKDSATEKGMFDKYHMHQSKNCGRGYLYVTVIKADETVEIGDVVSSVHCY
jgi:hypothetical protein